MAFSFVAPGQKLHDIFLGGFVGSLVWVRAKRVQVTINPLALWPVLWLSSQGITGRALDHFVIACPWDRVAVFVFGK